MTRKKPLKELTYLLHKVEVALNSLTSWANFFFFKWGHTFGIRESTGNGKQETEGPWSQPTCRIRSYCDLCTGWKSMAGYNMYKRSHREAWLLRPCSILPMWSSVSPFTNEEESQRCKRRTWCQLSGPYKILGLSVVDLGDAKISCSSETLRFH